MTFPATSAAASPMSPDELRRYADAIVGSCLRIGPGDLLALHGEPAHRDLLVALTEAGYRAGARYVDVVYSDPRVKRARILHAGEDTLGQLPDWHDVRIRDLLEQDAAIVTVAGEGEPGLLGDVDPARAAKEHSRTLIGVPRYLAAVGEGTARFCVVAWPTEGWADRVFPDAGGDAARRLAQDLLAFTRLGPDDGDGTAAWEEHVARLGARAETLTRLGLRGLELRAPGTALDLGLVPGTRWVAAESTNARGRTFCANFPTEEVFSTPDAAATTGTFRCSRPLTIEGRTIDGIAGEFREGRLLRVDADRDEDRRFLEAYLARDEGAGRLGEVALLDRTSRIGRSGRVYGSTLLDENAATHIAFGRGFDFARVGGAATGDPSVNTSAIHVDVMIGTDDMTVTGLDGDGARIPLIADGSWQL